MKWHQISPPLLLDHPLQPDNTPHVITMVTDHSMMIYLPQWDDLTHIIVLGDNMIKNIKNVNNQNQVTIVMVSITTELVEL